MHYNYKCTQCSSIYDADKIEKEFVYLCPQCGKAEKNAPLSGVLSIVYDYESLKKKLNREKFLNLTPGKCWNYPELLPLSYVIHNNEVTFPDITEKDLSLLSLNANPLSEHEYEGNSFMFMDETRNLTYSFKDRASILVALKAMQLGINEIAAASTGNAGSSIAGICARLGIKSHLFVPKNIPEAKRIQIQSYGANLYVVDGDYDNAFDLCLEVSLKNKWYNRNTAYNPLTIEGKKSGAFDIFIATSGNLPEYIFIPAGDGVILGGLYKGFSDLCKLGWIEKMPKLIAVQAKGSSAISDYFRTGKFVYSPASTIADSISAGAPRNLFMAVNAIKESNGDAVTVKDEEILSAQEKLAKQFGFLVEPSCAAAFAGYINFKEKISPGEKPLILLTGSGLKDFEALKKWNQTPVVRSAEEWTKYF